MIIDNGVWDMQVPNSLLHTPGSDDCQKACNKYGAITVSSVQRFRALMCLVIAASVDITVYHFDLLVSQVGSYGA